MQVAQLWRYPVKSMIGEQVDAVTLDTLGIVGDRTWAIRDLERGGIRGAKKIAGLMTLVAHDLGDGNVQITLPDGGVVATSDAGVHEQISSALGHRVRLEALRPPTDTDHYRRGAPDSDDLMAELRSVFGREDDEPLPDLSVFPPEILEYESPPGTYYDAFPLLIMSTAALDALAAAVPDSVIDVRRFRPSLVIDTEDRTGHPEIDWVGQQLTVGAATLEVIAPCPRCVMVTRHIDDSTPSDGSVLRHVVRDLDQNVGVYAAIRTPGVVNVGDAVTLVS